MNRYVMKNNDVLIQVNNICIIFNPNTIHNRLEHVPTFLHHYNFDDIMDINGILIDISEHKFNGILLRLSNRSRYNTYSYVDIQASELLIKSINDIDDYVLHNNRTGYELVYYTNDMFRHIPLDFNSETGIYREPNEVANDLGITEVEYNNNMHILCVLKYDRFEDTYNPVRTNTNDYHTMCAMNESIREYEPPHYIIGLNDIIGGSNISNIIVNVLLTILIIVIVIIIVKVIINYFIDDH